MRETASKPGLSVGRLGEVRLHSRTGWSLATVLADPRVGAPDGRLAFRAPHHMARRLGQCARGGQADSARRWKPRIGRPRDKSSSSLETDAQEGDTGSNPVRTLHAPSVAVSSLRFDRARDRIPQSAWTDELLSGRAGRCHHPVDTSSCLETTKSAPCVTGPSVQTIDVGGLGGGCVLCRSIDVAMSVSFLGGGGGEKKSDCDRASP